MKKLRLVVAFFTFFCSIFPAPAAILANEYANRSLTRRERKFDTVVMLPTQVMVVQTGFHGATEMFKEAKALETELSTLVDWAVRQKNPGLRPVWVGSDGATQDVNRSYLLADVQAQFDRLLPAILDDPARVRRGGYTMTDAVAKLAPQQSETLLVFTRLVGVDATLIASFFGFREGAQLIVAMVDGVSGEVMFVTIHKLRQTNLAATNAGFNSVLGGALVQLKRDMKRLPTGNPSSPMSQWSVMHAHSIGLPCEGWLYRTGSAIGFRSVSDIEHRWELPSEAIESIDNNAVRGIHIKLADGRNFNLFPSGIKRDRLISLLTMPNTNTER
jgi:hypothetical protein